MDGPVVADIRISFGGVAPMPWRARTAEAWLRGRSPEPATVAEAVDRELEAARPLRDNAYKLALVRNITVATVRDMTEE
jgi:xanthine dehydrogenase YagS FAD-binding subunit